MALAPLTLAPVDGQVPAVQLDVRHRPGRRAHATAAAVDRRPAVVTAAQRRRGVPQVPVVVRDQRRGAVLSGQHRFAGRRDDAAATAAAAGCGRRPDHRRRAFDQQRGRLFAATVTAVGHRVRHGGTQ